jgi:hypothetical protein
MPSNLERKARRKRQTRLVFEPNNNSSPAVALSPAKVRYSLHGEKDDSEDELSITMLPKMRNGRALPTPVKSSQMADVPIGTFNCSTSSETLWGAVRCCFVYHHPLRPAPIFNVPSRVEH